MAKQPFENLVQHLFQVAAQREFKPLNDQGLLKRYVENRDELAFGELVRRYKKLIWYICWRILQHHQDVEDAFQATVMTLFRRAKSILGHEAIEGWIHSTTFKVASRAKRGRNRRRLREERSAMMRRERYERPDCRWEIGEVLDKEINQIPEKLRSPLILCYLEGMTEKEAAQRLGVSIDALDHRLRRGRECLKKRLRKYGTGWGSTMFTTGLTWEMRIPEVPPGLVEKSLDMVRAVVSSQGVWETAGISPQVAMLTQGAWGIWTMKVKVLLGALLLTLVGVGVGMAKYGGWMSFHGEQPPQRMLTPAKKEAAPSKLPEKRRPQVDVYGDPLPAEALARIGTIRFRHRELSHGGTFLPDGKTVVTTDHNHITFWEMATGKPVRRLDGTGKSYYAVAITPDGKKLAVVSNGRKIEVWDLSTNQPRKTWENSDIHGAKLAFAPDGKTLAVLGIGNDFGSLWLFNASTGDIQRKIEKDNDLSPWFIVFSPDGKTLATSRGLWDTTTWRKRRLKQRDKQGAWCDVMQIREMAFSPDGKELAAISEELGILSLWNTTTGAEIRPITRVERSVCTSLAFRSDGRTLVVADHRGQFHFWNVATGKENAPSIIAETIYPGFPCAFNGNEGTCFSPDGKFFLRWQGSVIGVWDVATGRLVGSSPGGIHYSLTDLAFSPDGKSLATWAASNEIHVWEVETGRPGPNLEGCGKRYVLPPIDYTSADCLTAWTGREGNSGEHGRFIHWDVRTGKATLGQPVPETKGHFRYVSEDGQYQLWGSKKGIALFDCSTGKEIQRFPELEKNKGLGGFVTLSADGGTVLVYEDNTLRVWSVRTGRELMILEGQTREQRRMFMILGAFGVNGGFREQTRLSEVALSPDGRWLAAAQLTGPEPAIQLWEVASGYEVVPKISLPQGTAIHCLVWSPHGRLLAGGDEQGAIWLWDMVSMQEVQRFKGHAGAVKTLAFSRDGLRLASGSTDTTVLIWDIRHLSRREAKKTRRQSSDELWDALGKGAGEMLEAMDQLLRQPEIALPLLHKHLQLPPPPDLKRVTTLLAQLDDNSFKVRNQAVAELEKMDEQIVSVLREALAKKPSLEACRLIQRVLDKIAGPVGLRKITVKQLQRSRGVEVLERIGTPEALQLLTEIAKVGESTPAIEARAALQRLAKRHTVKK